MKSVCSLLSTICQLPSIYLTKYTGASIADPRFYTREISDPKVNILLVDDQAVNLLTVQAILRDLGQNFMQTHSAEEARRLLLTDDFAVILFDIQMQGMEALQTANLIRSREKSRQTPIIFFTA